MARKPTIAEALAAKLGRKPTDRELVREVKRILGHADAHGAPGENDPIE